MDLKKIRHDFFKNIIMQPFISALLMSLILLIILGVIFAVSRLAFIITDTGVITTLSLKSDTAQTLDTVGISSEKHSVNIKRYTYYDEITLEAKDDTADLTQLDQSIDSNKDDNKEYGGSSPISMPDPQSNSHGVSVEPDSQILESSSTSVVSGLNDSSEIADSAISDISDENSSTDTAEIPYLKSLKLSSGSLSPDFWGIEYEYKATVKNSVDSIEVDAVSLDPNAKVEISGDGKLDVGANTIEITVTSESGNTVRVYTIEVTRKKAEKKSGHTGNSSSSPVSELKAPEIELDEKNQPIHYKKLITGKATAYYNPSGNKLATGKSFKPGYVAVNPKEIPYGTKMYIVSPKGGFVYGYAIAADTGGFATNGSGTVVDLAFWTKSEVYNFGRRTMNIYILE